MELYNRCEGDMAAGIAPIAAAEPREDKDYRQLSFTVAVIAENFSRIADDIS